MKVNHKIILFSLCAAILFSCTNQQQAQAASPVGSEAKRISAVEFSERTQASKEQTIIDVRTPEEYTESHITNAINMNWNAPEFQNQVAVLDKSKPIYVYCMRGSRSAEASDYLAKNGFTEIYDLEGGITKWREAHLAEISDTSVVSAAGMTVQQYEALLKTDKYVLVDFYATWCGPCKAMEPILEDISKTMGDKVEIVRIDTDQNEELSKHFDIEYLPTIKIYKNQKLVWDIEGAQTKEQLLKHLK